jgi:Domain of Unknown Function (DUF748)
VADSGSPGTVAAGASPLRRRLGIIAAIVLAVAGLTALLLLVAPRHIARWVANNYLQGMQIDVEGVRTIDIALLKGEISMGPVRFHAGTADPGTIGLLGVKLSLRNLIERQALLQSVVLRDVDVSIRQTADGEIIVNGIPLRQLLAEQAAETQQREPATPAEGGGSGWGAGIDDMQVRDSRVTFTNRDGGIAVLHVEHLDLRGFRTWEPDQPGTFVLSANLNDIDVTAYGTAQPFAEKVTAQTEITIDGVDLRGIEQYTGPLGFQQAGGTLTLYARTGVELFPAGRVEGTANATMVLANVDLADQARGAIKLDQGSVETDTRVLLDEAGALSVAGTADVKLNQASGAPAAGPQVSLASAVLGLRRLQIDRQPDGAIALRLDPAKDGSGKSRAEITGAAVSGPARLTADRLTLDVDALTAQVGADGTANAQTTAALAADTGTLALGGGEQGETALSFAAAGVRLAKLTLTARNGSASMTATGDGNLQRLAAALPAQEGGQPRMDVAADALRLAFPDVRVQTAADGQLRIDGRLDAALAQVAGGWGTGSQPARPPEPAARGARRGRDVVPAAQAQMQPQDGRFAIEELTVSLAPLGARIAGSDVAADLSGAVALSGAGATVPTTPTEAPFDVKLGRFRLAFADLSASTQGGQASVAGKLETTLAGLSAVQPAPGGSSTRAGGRTLLSMDNARLALSPIEAKSAGEQTTLTAAGTAQVGKVSAELPKIGPKPAVDAAVAQLRANIERLTVETSPRGLGWQVRLDAQASGLESRTESGAAAAVKLRTLTVGGASANHRRQVAVERVVLDRPDAFLTRAYLLGAAAAPESRPREAAEAVEEAAEEGWRFKLDSLGLTGGGIIRVRDAQVTPNTNVTIGIDALQVQNLNTGDPAQQTQVRLEATINEFTELAVAGWAAPFGKQPDFDLNARLQRLELPALSPYAAQAMGVNVETGRLSLDATAAAAAGKLQGDLEVTLRDLGFSALSAEDAKRLSASVGVPIETIVGLLQDDQGRISLKLPLSGDLANPTFGLGDAIRQTVTGAVQAAVMAPFQLAFAPVSLIARAAGGGSGGGLALQPIPFSPGENRPGPTGADMLDGLARVLQERNKLSIKVCGRATAQDLQAALADEGAPSSGPGREKAIEQLAPRLWSLAGERTAEIRRLLISEAGAQPRQVGECRILYDPQDSGAPRVEVGL